jgi:protein-S-isoprenylcysteine O-methyltransferase Ste14
MSLKGRYLLASAVGTVLLGAVLFVPAGSFRFWQGWLYLSIQLVLGLFAVTYFSRRDTGLIERRMPKKEKIREQRIIMRAFSAVLLISYLLPGLDYRFGWSHAPLWLIILSQGGVVTGSLFIFWVMKVNSFAAATIQVETGQKVISSGPYRIVRHPMYLGLCDVFLFTPLALGSYYALPAFLLLVPLIVIRLLNEEKVLSRELVGYSDYCFQIRFRLVPCLW